MNDQVKKALENLMDTVRTSEEYICYRNAKETLKSQPEKMSRLSEFRKLRYQACREEDGGFEKAESLLHLQKEIEKDRECREYLFWENIFCMEIRKISEAVLELADVDVPL